MKKLMLRLSLFVLALALVMTGSGLAAAQEKITVTDLAHRQVTLARNPNRIIALSPGTLRLVIYLQAKDKVVGVEDLEKKTPRNRPYWLANNDLGSLPSVGPGGPASINKEPALEAILKVNPEVIFISYLAAAKADAVQEKLGIPVVVISYGPFGAFNETVYDSLRLMGRILDKEKRAEAVIASIEEARADLMKRATGAAESSQPGVYIGGIGFKGTQGIESTEAAYAPFQWVQARNLAAEVAPKGHLFLDKERLLALNPDIIFIDGGGLSNIAKDFKQKASFYQGLKAFQKGRVYVLHPYNWYMTNLGTVVADAYTVGKILYPERFADVKIKEKADEVYTFLVGKPVYNEMEKDFGPLGAPPLFLK